MPGTNVGLSSDKKRADFYAITFLSINALFYNIQCSIEQCTDKVIVMYIAHMCIIAQYMD